MGRPTRKSIFDPVHGPIALDGLSLALVATPEFQRLWGIRQTGLAHLVFPGANHTRLEHSLGTYWVAQRMAERLGVAPATAPRVAAGGLLHDLGHGPFSHTLDASMREVLGHGHETISRARIEGRDPAWPADRIEVPRVLERFGIAPRAVAQLLEPSRTRRPSLARAILHGPIDADRVDYLQRDAHYTGVAHGAIDAVRLFDTMLPRGGRVAFAEKGRTAVEGFLVGRSLMYSAVYYHRTVRAAEVMAQAAFERRPGYPAEAVPWFARTDGDLLVELGAAGGASAALGAALRERRLHKRAFGWGRADGVGRWRRWLADPAGRRSAEDEVAGRLGVGPGDVLFDLAGIEARGDADDDWTTVTLVEEGGTAHPFRGGGPWPALAKRPLTERAVSVYVVPRVRERAARWLARDPSALP
ncbi:MAG TPA: HD domain-containing protein [Thermoplasmata archaeon]|nr:HD domain-containing protein [Thermoplasmata archaeon]